MTCGGCSASVKKILESQVSSLLDQNSCCYVSLELALSDYFVFFLFVVSPQVATASVNLTTETAIVWPVPEAKSVPDWQKTLGEALANHLTNCGFESTPRGERVRSHLNNDDSVCA